jgi:putative glycosyltransferase (TIGR04372 family)
MHFLKIVRSIVNNSPFLSKIRNELLILINSREISYTLGFVKLISPNWNYVINFFSNNFFLFISRRNSILSYELLRIAILLRRFNEAAIFYRNLKNSVKLLADDLKIKFEITEFIIFEMEGISDLDIRFSNIKNLNFDIENIESLYSDNSKAIKLINEYFQLDFIFTNNFYKICKKIQNNEFSKISNSHESFKVVKLDKTWFDSVGHFYYLDSLLKGIILGLIPIRKLGFDQNLNKNFKISNISLYESYMEICKKHGIFYEINNEKELPILFLMFWPDLNGNLVNAIEFSISIQLKYILDGRKCFKFDIKLNKQKNPSFQDDFINLLSNKKIISFHIRQPSFKNEDRFVTRNSRNSNPEIVMQILHELASFQFSNKSIIFVMLGDDKMQKVPRKYQKFIFDYAHSSFKSPDFDAYLIQNTIAHLGTVSGISHLPCLFEKPTLCMNACPFLPAITTNTIFIPKLYKYKDKLLTFREFYNIKPFVYDSGNDTLNNMSLSIIDNSYEDLKTSITNFLDNVLKNDNENWFDETSVSLNFTFFPSKMYNSQKVNIERTFYEKYQYLFQ